MSLSADQRTRSCATELVCHDCGIRLPLLDTTFRCLGCGQTLDIDYDYELAKRRISEQPIGARELNIWRFEELLVALDRDPSVGFPAEGETGSRSMAENL